MTGKDDILVVDGLSRRFGGLLAVNEVSFAVRRGEIFGLIGPNGAGKTTTFNVISGRFAPTAGDVRLDGKHIQGMRPDRIAALGVARTFQGTRTFPRLSVAQNIETALFSANRLGFWEDWLGIGRARETRRAVAAEVKSILDFVGLSKLKDVEASALAYAHQSLLGIGLALALRPKLLLLDEPFAGMNPHETGSASQMVRRIRDTGVTVLLVEHDMTAVMGLCDRIVVLDQGSKIAEGKPAEIRANPRVIEAYLGIDDDA